MYEFTELDIKRLEIIEQCIQSAKNNLEEYFPTTSKWPVEMEDHFVAIDQLADKILDTLFLVKTKAQKEIDAPK